MENDIRNRSTGTDKESLLAHIALLYYGEGLTQSEIATRMGLSRATIVNYLRESRESGIVDIRINGGALAASGLSRRLCEKFGLKDAYVAYLDKADDAETDALRTTGRVGAMALVDIVRPGDSVGIAWGVTIKQVADLLPSTTIKDVTVRQMVGSMDTDRLPAAETCAIEVAKRLGAECHTLHAPAILSSPQLAKALHDEPTIRGQLKRLRSLDMAAFSIGDTTSQTHLVAAGIATDEDLARAIRNGACGIVSGRYYDDRGRPLADPLDDRMVAITIDELKATPKRLLIVSGASKLPALRAALAGKLATHLCIDEALARSLLETTD